MKNMSEKRRGTGELVVLQQLNRYEFAVELWFLREGLNRNRWDFRNIKDHYLTFVGRPILCAYVGGEIGDGHNMRTEIDPMTGKEYQSFTGSTAERIVGTLSDDPADFSLEEKDGQTWIRAKGKLFAFYAKELVDKIVRAGRMDVSVEAEIEESETAEDREIFLVWYGLGVTILGDYVDPAVPGAHIAALKAMEQEFKEVKLRAAALNKPQAKNNKKTPRGVRKTMSKNAMKRLAGKFEGYHIVGLSDDERHVALLNGQGEGFTYTFNEEDKGEVVASRITPANLSVQFPFNEEVALAVDMEDVLSYVVASGKDQAATIKNLNEKIEQANATIQSMEQAEHQRRIDLVKETVNAALAAIEEADPNAAAGLKAECEKIAAAAEDYAKMEKDGKFCGAERAKQDLMALHGEHQVELAKAAQKKEKKVWAWDKVGQNGNSGDDTSVDGLLNKWGIH